jgi:hypothetical protein
MTDPQSAHARLIRPARRISASSGSPLAPPKASPSVLELLGRANPRAHADRESII